MRSSLLTFWALRKRTLASRGGGGGGAISIGLMLLMEFHHSMLHRQLICWKGVALCSPCM